MSQKPLAEPAVESLRDALGTLPGAADSSLRRSETPANAPAPEGSALRSYAAAAVREILAAAERQPQTGRPQVDLRLQTFDHENVQVQMRWHNGVIETRFVTDTPELQQALSREWQTAAPQMAEKGLKFADPSFDRHDHDSSEKQPGQADSSFGQQRHTRGDSDSERPAPVFGVPTFLAAARANAELPADLPAQARRLDAEPNPNSRKLHAWA